MRMTSMTPRQVRISGNGAWMNKPAEREAVNKWMSVEGDLADAYLLLGSYDGTAQDQDKTPDRVRIEGLKSDSGSQISGQVDDLQATRPKIRVTNDEDGVKTTLSQESTVDGFLIQRFREGSDGKAKTESFAVGPDGFLVSYTVGLSRPGS